MDPVTFTISVRELVEFAYRTGSLGGTGKFLSSTRAVEGTKGHRRIQRSRGEGYRPEVTVEKTFTRENVVLRVLGRIDGLMDATTPPLVEEIKTVEGDWSGTPDPLHLAQLRIYAAIMCAQNEWAQVETRLTYLNLDNDSESPVTEIESAATLASFLEVTLDLWFEWLIPQALWKQARNESVTAMVFPLGGFRAGQRSLSAAVYRAIRDGGRLFAEAPTGTGKTLATLFPAAKALPLIEGQIFYVTAKNPGRIAATEALGHLRTGGAKLRSVEITAKRKICFGATATEGCDLRTCPYALGYFDRFKPALRELLGREHIDREAIEEVARAHTVCPFELSLDASNWTDVVIGDFNYVFDPTARLQRHFGEGGQKHVVLVDEAHNLVDRSRKMYSASISAEMLTLRGTPMKGSGSRRALNGFKRAKKAVEEFLALPGESTLQARDYHDRAIVLATRPDALIDVLRESASAIEGFLAEQDEGTNLSEWIEPWFEMLAFLRVAELFDGSFRTIIDGPRRAVTLFCADASALLHETLKTLRAAVFFSATLSPAGYFRDLLGGREGDVCIALPSPFDPRQMHVAVLGHDVTFKGRAASFDSVARAVAAHIEANPGNHLVFAPSFSYLRELAEKLEDAGLTCIEQTSSMDEGSRAAFLDQFAKGGNAVGIAVLGGIFAEGIDLPGDRVVGVTVIGIGIPRLSIERDILQAHFETTRGAGFDFAYRFPGMQRVLQAVGRLIR
ncbi:MAG TPA: ATP-dependent DNA helicase, partial [Chthoniobacterales bacterium]|nr:ATP-dependent DNA helicase [Chthoniobacterales bacterium]